MQLSIVTKPNMYFHCALNSDMCVQANGDSVHVEWEEYFILVQTPGIVEQGAMSSLLI